MGSIRPLTNLAMAYTFCSMRTIKPLYDARVEDLMPGDLVIAECACGHSIAITPSTLVHGLRLQPYERILDLAPRMRCRECDERGKVVVSIRWAAARSAAG